MLKCIAVTTNALSINIICLLSDVPFQIASFIGVLSVNTVTPGNLWTVETLKTSHVAIDQS